MNYRLACWLRERVYVTWVVTFWCACAVVASIGSVFYRCLNALRAMTGRPPACAPWDKNWWEHDA